MICRKLPHLPLYLWSDLLAMDKLFWPYIVCIPAPIDIIIYIATRSQQSAIPGHLHDHLKKMHTPMESEWELEDSIDRRNKGNLPFNNQLSLINCTPGPQRSPERGYQKADRETNWPLSNINYELHLIIRLWLGIGQCQANAIAIAMVATLQMQDPISKIPDPRSQFPVPTPAWGLCVSD